MSRVAPRELQNMAELVTGSGSASGNLNGPIPDPEPTGGGAIPVPTPPPAPTAQSKKPGPATPATQSVGSLEMKVYDADFYQNELHACFACPEKLKLSDLYVHYETAHKLLLCIFCKTTLNSAKDLAMHLNKQHGAPYQKFPHAETFVANCDQQFGVTLMCFDCRKSFNSATDTAQLLDHACERSTYACKKCQLAIGISDYAEHDKKCKRATSVAPDLRNKSPIRSLETLCKRCGKAFAPAKLASHLKDCTGVQVAVPAAAAGVKNFRRSVGGEVRAPPSSSQPLDNNLQRQCKKCGKMTPANKFYAHVKTCASRSSKPVPVAQPKLEAPEEVEEPAPETLDPLLLEQDPEKRIDMLISELAAQMGEQPVENGPPQKFTVTYFGPIKHKSDAAILQELLLRSCEVCAYCRQATLIRVDKRQLVIHLFQKHRWEIIIAPEPEQQQLAIEAGGDRQVPGQAIANGEVVPEVQETIQELVRRAEQVLSVPRQVGQAQAEFAQSEQLEGTATEKEQTDVVPIPETGEDGALVRELTKGEGQREDEECTPKKAELMLEAPGSLSLSLLSAPSSAPSTTVFDWNEFQLEMLRLVFHSKFLLFNFKRPNDAVFGSMPCECLLCGFRVENQLKFFAHWRSSHKSIAMTCLMCTGRFLFSGSLFSHHCFGTARPFIEAKEEARVKAEREQVKEEETGIVPAHSDAADSLYSTMLLRYQCEFCDLNLPGFFNYMVHLRRTHNTCELCLETVDNQRMLERHDKRHKLQHFCWKCGVAYIAKPNYMTHLYWKHGSESQVCSLCLEKKWPFIYHFCIPSAQFTCETCGLQFTRPKALIVHRRLHSNENLRRCPHTSCTGMFISKKLMEKHLLAEHVGKKSTPIKSCAENEQKDEGNDQGPTEAGAGSAQAEAVVENVAQPQTPMETTDSCRRPDSLEMAGESLEGKLALARAEGDGPKVENLKDNSSEMQDDEKGKDSSTSPEKSESNIMTESRDEERICVEGEVKPTQDQIEEEKGQEVQTPDSEPAKKRKKRRSKSSKGPSFSISALHGPNLSEDEASHGSENEDLGSGGPEVGGGTQTELTNLFRPQSVDDGPELESLFNVRPPTLDGDDDLANLFVRRPPTPNMDLVNEKLDDPMPDAINEGEYKSAVVAGSETANPDAVDGSSAASFVPPDANSSLPAVVQMDISPTKDVEDGDVDVGSMSPLLPPLEDFGFADLPNFEDAVTSENHIKLCAAHDHDYYNMRRQEPTPKELKRKLFIQNMHLYGEARVPQAKKTKSRRPKSPKKMESEHKRRKRHRSSSLSSSASSKTSCSSCGSDCSCSSSSSSDDEMPDVAQQRPIQKLKLAKMPVKVLQKRGRKPNPNKPPKPARDPNLPKRPVGRPPKYPKTSGDSPGPAKPQPPKPKPKDRTQERIDQILKHFRNKEDAFILESDLDTDDSGSEEIFNKRQLEEVIGTPPSVFEEVWNQDSEKFLLQVVKGVKELQELRPKPKALVRDAGRRNGQQGQSPSPVKERSNYAVVSKGAPSNGQRPKLKVRNVPIKPLYLVNMSSKNTKSAAFAAEALRQQARHFEVVSNMQQQNSNFNNNRQARLSLNRVDDYKRPRPQAAGMGRLSAPGGSTRRLNAAFNDDDNGRIMPNKMQKPSNMRPGTSRNFVRQNTNASMSVTMVAPLPAAAASGLKMEFDSTPVVANDGDTHTLQKSVPIAENGSPYPAAATDVKMEDQSSNIKPEFVIPEVPKSAAAKNGKAGGKKKSTPVKRNEPLYCWCQSPHDHVSDMIGCDGKHCQYEWFHYECVGIVVPPPGKWFCPDCRVERSPKKNFPNNTPQKMDLPPAATATTVNVAKVEEQTNGIGVGESDMDKESGGADKVPSAKPWPTNCSSLLGA